MVVIGAAVAVVVAATQRTSSPPARSTPAAGDTPAWKPPTDQQVRTRGELIGRARDPRSDGKTFYLRAGSYGELTFNGVRHNRLLTFRAYPGETPVLTGAALARCRNLRFEGIRFVGTVDIQPGDSSTIKGDDLQFVDDEFGDPSWSSSWHSMGGPAINIREFNDNVLVQDSTFHYLHHANGHFGTGYGVRASGAYGPINNLTVKDSTFAHLGADAMEFGGVVGGTIDGNRESDVRIEPGSEEHSDPLMIWAGSRNITVRNNFFHDNSQPLYFADGTRGGVLENNIFARGGNWCMQMGGIGERTDGVSGAIMRNNTFWDCRFGGLIVRGDGTGNVVTNNILQTLEGTNLGRQFATEDYNLITKGYRGGAHDLGGAPRFAHPSTLDYHLAPHSRGIDAATSAGAPKRDSHQTRRSDDPDVSNRGGGRPPYYDIGALERFVRRG
jgi:hypothetical protein